MILYNKRTPGQTEGRSIAWSDNNDETHGDPLESINFRKLRSSGLLQSDQLMTVDFGDERVRFCEFGGLNLTQIRVDDTQFHGCCFDTANLYGADLRQVYFHGCSFLNTNGIIDLGIMNDYAGFAFFKQEHIAVLPLLMIKFGCTALSYEEAIEHWHDERHDRTFIRRATELARDQAWYNVRRNEWPNFRVGSDNVAYSGL